MQSPAVLPLNSLTRSESVSAYRQNVKCDILDWRETEDSVATKWRFSAVLDLPWRPLLAAKYVLAVLLGACAEFKLVAESGCCAAMIAGEVPHIF